MGWYDKEHFKELDNYVRGALGAGKPVKNIVDVLQKDGWPEKEILASVMRVRDGDYDLAKLKHEMKDELPRILDEDVKKLLRVLDAVLRRVPNRYVKSYYESGDYELYKRVMKKTYDPLTKDVDRINLLEKVVVLLERKVINEDEARNMLGLPVRVIKPRIVDKKSKEDILKSIKGMRK